MKRLKRKPARPDPAAESALRPVMYEFDPTNLYPNNTMTAAIAYFKKWLVETKGYFPANVEHLCSSNIQIDIVFGHYDEAELELTAMLPMSPIEIMERREDYIAKMATYNEWYHANKEEVDAELERRRLAKLEKTNG